MKEQPTRPQTELVHIVPLSAMKRIALAFKKKGDISLILIHYRDPFQMPTTDIFLKITS